MNRRQLLAFLGFFSFGGAFWRFLKPSWQAEASEVHVTRSVAALADVMFAGEGLPGASELGIHRRVLEMAELATSIANGIAWLDNYATRQGAADFVGLDEAQKLAALDAAFASHDEGIQPFVLALRYHLGMAYYAAPAVKQAFAYTGAPQPEGFPDFQERPA
jgi:gluconate 2-dehydrogenase subunit 3-like protein